MERPKRAFARLVGSSRNFAETVVERQRMANAVLPTLLVLTVIREMLHYKLVDFAQSTHCVLATLYSHGDKRNVRKRRLGV